MVAFHKNFVFHPIITRESSLGTKFLKPASSHAFVKADDFLGQYQMMEQHGVASAEEVKVENLADHTQNRDDSCRNGVRDAMLRPKLLLLDEPSFGLAPLVVQEIYQLLSGVADGGIYASLALALMIDLTLAV
jgi:ABC-type molybdenum transport system ATPase subunit/photorepair protein PhrA